MAETFPMPVELSTAEADALSGTTHERTTLPYLPADASDVSTPTYFQRFYRWLFRLFNFVHGAAAGMAYKTDTLEVGALPLRYRKADGTAAHFEGGTIALTPNATNYVYIDTATNLLAKSTVGWPADITTFIALAEFVCDASDITTADDAADRRGLNAYHVNASSTSPTGTTAAAFTLDSDNAGPGADQQVRFNRGSTDAEDAAVEWDETNDRINCKSQHTTGTLCPINASEVQVAGTAIIGADGNLEAAALATDQLYVVGANGDTANGLRLTAMGGSGAPSAGAHAVGELAVDSAGQLYICTGAGTPGTWQGIGKQDGGLVVSLGDDSGPTETVLHCAIQIKDRFGGNVNQAVVLDVYLMDDTDGAVDAPNVTAFSVTTGTLLRTITEKKVYRIKTTAGGAAVLDVDNSIADQVFVLAAPPPGSPPLDCSDRGTLTWT